jgi:CubicO group peptidase (beta-lactamase class C family)
MEKREMMRPMSALLLASFLCVASAAAGQTALPVDRAKAIDSYLGAYLEKTGVPGFSCVVVRGQDVAYLKGFGVEYAGTSRPMTPDSSSAIGSLTKSFTCLAVMQLVERGKIELDAPVISYLPWFRLADKAKSDKITVRMLMGNRSGIPSLDAFSGDVDSSDSAIERGVRMLASAPINREPGSSFEYANENFCILGLIIAKASGLPYREYLCQNIFEPLGMNRTSTDLATLERMGSLTGHVWDIDGFKPSARRFTAMGLPAGTALSCSARDMGAYLSMMMNGGEYRGKRLVSAESVKLLTTATIAMAGLSVEMGGSGKDEHYAMGWMRSEIEGYKLVDHGGNIVVMSSMTAYDPEGKLGVSLLFNHNSGIDPYKYDTSVRLCYNVLRLADGKGLSDFGIPRRKDPNLAEAFVALPEQKTRRLIGSYESENGYQIEIFESGGGLAMHAEKGIYDLSWKLEFINESRMIGISIGGTERITVAYADDGTVRSLAMMGTRVFPKARKLPSGYASVRPAGLPWILVLPEKARIEREGGTLRAIGTYYEMTVSLESGKSDDPDAFIPAGLKVFRSGGVFTETRKGALFRQRAFEIEGARSMFVAVSGQGKSFLVIRLYSSSGSLTRALQEALVPLLDGSVF